MHKLPLYDMGSSRLFQQMAIELIAFETDKKFQTSESEIEKIALKRMLLTIE